MLGKQQVTVRWVDTMKSDGDRSRLVARNFKGGGKDRDDLFAATPPLEIKTLLISRAAPGVKGKLIRKLLFIDAKKAHLNPECKEDAYIQLPQEADGGPCKCGKWKIIMPRSLRRQALLEEMLAQLIYLRPLGERSVVRDSWRRLHLLWKRR